MSTTGKTRWLLAGQQLLRDGGILAVKIEALAEVAGLTTGSFYHHFPNMAAYRAALADFYGSEQVAGTLATLSDDEPRDRLRRLVQIARDDALGSLDAAMRDWGGSDPVAATAVRALDATLLEHFATAFRDMGHDESSARVRALLLLSAGVARVHLPWSIDDPTGAILDLLGRPDEPGPGDHSK